MGHNPIKPDENLAPKLTRKSFTLLGEVLAAVGRPFYLLLSYCLILILFIAYITGYFTRILSTNLFNLALSKRKIIYPKPKLQNLIGALLKVLSSFLSSLSNLLALVFKALATLLVITAYLASSLWEFLKNIANLILKGLKLIKPKKWLKLLGLKLRLKLARVTSAISRVRIPKLKLVLALGLTIFLISLVSAYSFWLLILRDLPEPGELVTRRVDVSTKIYDRNGILLYKIFKDQNRTLVELENVPLHVRLATLAIEDAEFYKHPGFSVRGIARAIIRNVRRGELTGGSTITQQLVKNALLTPEKTAIRKLREIVLAVEVELHFSKDEILEIYLNEVAYGGTAYGIQEASLTYFGKNVDQLSLGEAALLAGLPKSPTRFSPFGPNPLSAFNRQKEVLHLMQVNGYITTEQRKAAEEEVITFAPNKTDIKAPHFVMYIRQALVEKYGEEVVAKGGLEVITTLDYPIQKMAEEVVSAEVKKLSGLKVGNGAALVVDVGSGEILAMVGSKDYFDVDSDGNVNLTTALRQPGSSIKIVNYSYALSNGLTPTTILSDTPVTFLVEGQPPYTPRNYDSKFRGKLPLRSALAESRNIPAVKVLSSYGVDKMIEQGRKMGISTWTDLSNYGLSLTLGGGEVKLIDLAHVYATVANYGTRPEISSVLRVTNYEGNVLEENKCVEVNLVNPAHAAEAAETALDAVEAARQSCNREQVLDPRVAYLLIDILKDNQARTPAFGSNSLLVIPGHSEVAVKTGTSNDLRDNLIIGFNQKYLVAVWVGNNDNSPMSRVASGITGATPIWHKIISALLAKEESAGRRNDWEIPEGLVQLPICALTNSLACEGCFTQMEWFLEENKPERACNPEYIKQIKKEKEEEASGQPPASLQPGVWGQILEPAVRIER